LAGMFINLTWFCQKAASSQLPIVCGLPLAQSTQCPTHTTGLKVAARSTTTFAIIASADIRILRLRGRPSSSQTSPAGRGGGYPDPASMCVQQKKPSAPLAACFFSNRRPAFASAPSASSAPVTDTCPGEHVPINPVKAGLAAPSPAARAQLVLPQPRCLQCC
jgi:hypothetical protein